MLYKKKHETLIAVFVLVCFLTSCSVVGYLGIGGQQYWPPKKKAAYFMKTYNDTYDECLEVLTNAKSTPKETQLAKVRVELIKELHPLIVMYDNKLQAGEEIPQTLENRIWTLIDDINYKGM